MWGDPVGPTFALQSALPPVAFAVLRLIAGLVLGFALSLACAWVAAFTCLEIERHDRRATASR